MMQITRVEGLGSPAAIRHDGVCREVLVDSNSWDGIPGDEKRSIILHEYAHCAHDVYSEEEADAIALKYLIAEGGDPQDAIDALINNLPHNPSVTARVNRLRALTNDIMCEQCAKISYFGGIPVPALDFDLFGTQLDEAALSPEGFDNVSDLTSQPAEKGKFWDFLGDAAIAAGQIFGQRPRFQPEPGQGVPPRSTGGSMTGWLIGGGVILLLVVLYFVAKKK